MMTNKKVRKISPTKPPPSSARFKKRMKELNLTLRKIEAMTGFSYGTIWNLSQGYFWTVNFEITETVCNDALKVNWWSIFKEEFLEWREEQEALIERTLKAQEREEKANKKK